MRRPGRIGLGVATAALLAGGAWAGTALGAAREVEVLGWSPEERRVYVQLPPRETAGSAAGVHYFDLDGPDPERPIPVTWPQAGGRATPREPPAALRRRLLPMRAVRATARPIEASVVVTDTAAECHGAVRHCVDARWPEGMQLRVTCFHDSGVVVRRAYAVPGRTMLLVVVAFEGDCAHPGRVTEDVVFLAVPGVQRRYVPWVGIQ